MSRRRGNGSLSYSKVNFVVLHSFISRGRTSIGCPFTTKSLELKRCKLWSKSLKLSRRKRQRFAETAEYWTVSASRKNIPRNVELPWIASRRAGLSCSLSPLLNQWTELCSILSCTAHVSLSTCKQIHTYVFNPRDATRLLAFLLVNSTSQVRRARDSSGTCHVEGLSPNSISIRRGYQDFTRLFPC